MLGRLVVRGWSVTAQVLACGVVRVLHNAVTTAFFIWVITGGLDAYAGTYDALGRRVGLQVGTADALVLTAIGLVGWAVFASVVQVLVYRRGLRRWNMFVPSRSTPPAGAQTRTATERPSRRRPFDPRAVGLAAAIAFVLLLSSTAWLLLSAMVLWLALAWLAARPDHESLKTGLAFAAILAAGALIFSLGGGLGIDIALRRAARAALLVLVATWLRGAAGAEGLREVSRRVLGKLRRLPGAPEAATVLDQIASEGRISEAGRALADRLSGVPKRPVPFLDAVLDWVVRESSEHRPPPSPAQQALRTRVRDGLLIALAALPAALLV
jgi:hypothetical protein